MSSAFVDLLYCAKFVFRHGFLPFVGVLNGQISFKVSVVLSVTIGVVVSILAVVFISILFFRCSNPCSVLVCTPPNLYSADFEMEWLEVDPRP